MNYSETVEWLFQQFPSYQNIGAQAYKPDLENVAHLCTLFNNPQINQTFVHVAGTNGKGSTSSLIASCLTEAVLNVGLFTSPHIKSFTERIRINGIEIEENFVISFVSTIRKSKLSYQPSFFEISFVMSLAYFRERKTHINIIETGLGGRLDATNIINPLLSVITNIGLEHTNFLGNTLESIASEKAGIIKENTPIVIGEYQKETLPIFEKIASLKKSQLTLCNQEETKFDTSLLFGQYLIKNARTAYTAINVLNQIFAKNYKLLSYFDKGIQNLYSNTGLRARMQLISKKPRTVFDAAHNTEGIQALISNIHELQFEKLHIIYGTSSDKDLNKIGVLLPKNALYYLSTFKNIRSTTTDKLKELSDKFTLKATYYTNPVKALADAQNTANEDDIILVFGSFFLLDDLF